MREERELYARGGLGPPMVLSYTLQRMLKVHKPFTRSREGLAEVDSGFHQTLAPSALAGQGDSRMHVAA